MLLSAGWWILFKLLSSAQGLAIGANLLSFCLPACALSEREPKLQPCETRGIE